MNNKEFDVIIVGSGIGGLVCAAFLAKRGLKIGIFEKNREPGGYCTTYLRRGFKVDTCIHAIQNCEKGSLLEKIFVELNLQDKVHLVRVDPTDSIFVNNQKIDIENDLRKTKENFKALFKTEAVGLDSFFTMLTEQDMIHKYYAYRNISFSQLLDKYFVDTSLKDSFKILLGNIGSIAEETCALSAITLLKQFIISGGYYPLGGMQKIPDGLVSCIEQHGGKIFLESMVKKIVVEDGVCRGVVLQNGEHFLSNIIVSNADMSFTYTSLLKDFIDKDLIRRIAELDPSYSIYITYLLLNQSLEGILECGPGMWLVNADSVFKKDPDLSDFVLSKGIFCSITSKLDSSMSPAGHDQVRIMVNTKHHTPAFFRTYGKRINELLIGAVEKFIPDLSSMIICQGRSTSITMKNYSLNRDGAIAGWKNSIVQVTNPVGEYFPEIPGLFFVGHWVTQKYGNGGVAMAADSGRNIAKHILRHKFSCSTR